LKQMTVTQVRAKYAEVFREEARSVHTGFLIKGIAWRLQSRSEGDLSEHAQERADKIGNDADIRMCAAKMPARNMECGNSACILLTCALWD